MPTRKVELTEHLENFIQSGIASGLYRDADEIVREGLRLLEVQHQRSAKLEWLRGAIGVGVEALEQGDSVTLESEEDLSRFMKEIREEAAEESRRRVG